MLRASARLAAKTARLRPPPATPWRPIQLTRRSRTLGLDRLSSQHSHSHGQHSSSSHSPFIALIPLFLASSTLKLDSADPGLAEITSQIGQPEANEFLIADGHSVDDSPPTLFWRTIYLVRDYVLEPLSTSIRFVHLALLFLPVILASPVLLLEALDGSNDRRKGRQRSEVERASTRWWYRFLVHQMQMAGPTFIKVRLMHVRT